MARRRVAGRRVAGSTALDEVDRLGGEHVGLVAAVGAARGAVVVQEPVPVVHDAAQEAGEFREPAPVGMVAPVVQAAVPLAHVAGAVAGGAEHVAHGALAQRDTVEATVRFHAQRAATVVVAPGEQRRARRSAQRRAAVVLGATHALGGEPVDVGGGQDGVAVAAQIAVAEVVGHHQNDVGAGAGQRVPARYVGPGKKSAPCIIISCCLTTSPFTRGTYSPVQRGSLCTASRAS